MAEDDEVVRQLWDPSTETEEEFLTRLLRLLGPDPVEVQLVDLQLDIVLPR